MNWLKGKKDAGGPPFSPLAEQRVSGNSDDRRGGLMTANPSSSFPAVTPNSLSDDSATSLRETVKKRLLNDMILAFAAEAGSVVMCVDKFTIRVLSSVLKMSELLEENILHVEDITMRTPKGEYLRRQPLPALTAIYFIRPNVESVNRLIADFRDKKNPMYKSCYLYFSSRLSDALFMKLKASAAIGKVAGFKELNLELCCSEANTFTLDSPESLPVLFAPDDTPASTEAKLQEQVLSPSPIPHPPSPVLRPTSHNPTPTSRMPHSTLGLLLAVSTSPRPAPQHRLASMVATLCATLGEMPHIRHAARPMASSVATILHTKLTEMAAPGSSFPSRILSVSGCDGGR